MPPTAIKDKKKKVFMPKYCANILGLVEGITDIAGLFAIIFLNFELSV